MKAIAVLGPTAAGKSEVAIRIAERCGGEVVSVDSMQVYRGMDIGTAKATEAMQQRVPHHLLDLCEPSYDMSVAEFQREGTVVLARLMERGVVPVICGGSGLHFRALVDPLEFPPRDESVRAEVEALPQDVARDRLLQLDPAAALHIDLANPRRVVRALEIALVTGMIPSERAQTAAAAAIRDYTPTVDFVAIGVDPGDELGRRIESRFDAMVDDGLLAEVESLRTRLGRLARQAVGYKELLPVVAGEREFEEGRAAAIQATRALGKRQRTFFRRDPRIHWLAWEPTSDARAGAAIDFLDGQQLWTS